MWIAKCLIFTYIDIYYIILIHISEKAENRIKYKVRLCTNIHTFGSEIQYFFFFLSRFFFIKFLLFIHLRDNIGFCFDGFFNQTIYRRSATGEKQKSLSGCYSIWYSWAIFKFWLFENFVVVTKNITLRLCNFIKYEIII